MALKFEITGDNKNLLRSLDGAKNGVRQAASDIEKSGLGIENMFKRIGAAAGIAFSLNEAKSFVKKVVEMRSFFQDIESSMKVFLGNEQKAIEFTQKLKDYAYYNMFEFKDLAEASQQMIAYGHAIDDIIPRLDQLSNIAVGTHGNLMELVAAYNKAKSTGIVDAHGIQSWAVKGVVIRDVLKELGEEAKGTSVTFEQLNKVIDHVTGEGGMFHDLQLSMMENISAEIGQFEDNFNAMLNEIGEKYQDYIVNGIKLGSELVDNYKEIAKYIQDAVVAIGLYKTALIAANGIEKAHIAWKQASAIATRANTIATLSDASAKGTATAATVLLNHAQKALNATILVNPYVLATMAIAAMVFGLYKLATAESAAEAGIRKANEELDHQKELLDAHSRATKELISVIQDNNATEYARLDAYKKLEKEAPLIANAYSKEQLAVMDLDETQKMLNKDIDETRTKNLQDELNDWKGVFEEITKGGVVTDETIKKVQERFESCEVRSKRVIGRIAEYIKELQGEYDKIINTQNEVDNAKPQPEKKTSKEWRNDLRKQLKEAQKELNDFNNGKGAYATQTFSKEERDNKRKVLEDRVKNIKSDLGTDDSKQTKERQKNIKEQQKYIELQEKLAIEQRRAQEDLELETRQAEINLMDESIEQVLEQYKLDFEKEKLAIERGYEDLKQAKIDKARELFEANPANEGKVFDSNSVDTSYTKDEEINFNAKINANLKDYQEKVQEFAKTGSNYLRDFLKEFGTLEEKRYAIVMQYEDLISKAITENEKKKLRAERDRDLATLKAQRLANEIDWSQTFKGIGGVLDGIAKETLKKVDEYMGTDEFKNLDSANKQAYSDLRDKLVEGGSLEAKNPFSTSTWSDIAKFADEYKQSVLGLIAANDAHKNAVNELIDAEKRLEEATEESEKARIRAEIDVAKWKVENTANGANEAEDKKNDAQKKLKDATEQASQGLTNFNTILGQITEGSLSGFATGIANVINQINGSGKKVSNAFSELAGKAGGIIGAILTIIDLLGDDPAGFFKDILDKIANLIDGLLSKAPEILMSIVSGIGNIIGAVIKGIGNSLTFGLLSRSNEEEMEKRIAELADVNKSLAERIDDLAETISKSSSTNQEAIDAYKVQMELEDEWLENQRESIKARAGEWTNSGYGFLKLCGKNSFLNHMESNSWEGWKRMSDVLKKVGYDTDVNRDNFFDLSPEALRILRDYASQDYAHILEGDGHKNPKDLIEQYIEHAGRYDELVDAFNEKMTGYNLEGFYDQYKKLLNDMKSDTKDFADSIEDLISNALLNAIVNEHFRDRIETLYKYISEAVQSDGLDENEINNIREENEKIVNDMLAEREALIKAGMIKTAEEYKQEVSSGGWQSMGQETAGELNGRFTALQISGEKISEGIASMVATLATLSALADGRNITLTEIRNLMITNNAYLEDILDANKKAYQKFEQQFDKIITQTK